MYLLREARLEDIDQLLELSKVGMTSLPTRKEEMQKKSNTRLPLLHLKLADRPDVICLV